MKKFEKVEKTVFFRAKFFFHCTLSVILGVKDKLLASKVRVLLLYVRMHTIGHASLHKMTRLRYAQWECRLKSARIRLCRVVQANLDLRNSMVPFLNRFMFDLTTYKKEQMPPRRRSSYSRI